MGKWTYQRREDLHYHDYPMNAEDARIGDRWECSCGREFEIISRRIVGRQMMFVWNEVRP